MLGFAFVGIQVPQRRTGKTGLDKCSFRAFMASASKPPAEVLTNVHETLELGATSALAVSLFVVCFSPFRDGKTVDDIHLAKDEYQLTALGSHQVALATGAKS